MPQLLRPLNTIRKRKNRYQLSHAQKCYRYWQSFNSFPQLKQGYLKWCQLSNSISRQSRLLLNGISVDTLTKGSIRIKDLITLCNCNILIYENACGRGPEMEIDVHYIKALIPYELGHSFFRMFEWISSLLDSLYHPTFAVSHYDPTRPNKLFAGAKNKFIPLFIYTNYFDVHKWKNFLQLFCFCVKMYSDIYLRAGANIKKTKRIICSYQQYLAGKSELFNKLFKSLLFDRLVYKDVCICDFVYDLFDIK